MLNTLKFSAFVLFLLFTTGGFAQSSEKIKPDGTWYREDGQARQLSTIPEGIKLVADSITYIYYKTGENTYQMHWTAGANGIRYRWTLVLENQVLIENTYENEYYPGLLKYKYTRVLR